MILSIVDLIICLMACRLFSIMKFNITLLFHNHILLLNTQHNIKNTSYSMKPVSDGCKTECSYAKETTNMLALAA